MNHKKIMIMGTASGVGKSIITAGLCRVFFKDGFSVAPFKSQNMALNSYITKEGAEIGRAQVVQAIASGIEPRYYLNPILLKPNGNGRIQVIINGSSRGNMSSIEYGKYKKELKKDIINAYLKIKERFEICVIEGAGSPVELNLKEDDVANMGVAHLLNAPVVLVADIDKGGVFASIYGTIELMEKEERERVKGVIINKFRGDLDVLKSGIERLENLIKIPILGVVPYFHLDIEEEDGATEKLERIKEREKKIRISVLKLKHISNFTDFEPLKLYDDVEINYVERVSDLGDEEIIIIPGSKNTIDDIIRLKENGIASKLIELSREGKIIIGICGGMQILGDKVIDSDAVEGEIEEISGLALLNLQTVLKKDKMTAQYVGVLRGGEGIFKDLRDIKIKGYEIHQGITTGIEKNITDDNRIVAVVKENIFATYLHGIFENKEFSDYLINKVRELKGIKQKGSLISYEEYRLKELDRLEDIIRKSVDIKKIYGIIEGI